MVEVLLVAAGWLFGPILLILAVAWIYRLVEDRMGHDPLDDVLGHHQERQAELILFPTRGRQVMGSTQRSPRAASTAEGMTGGDNSDVPKHA